MKTKALLIAGVFACISLPGSSFCQTAFAGDYAMNDRVTADHQNVISANESDVNSRAVLHFHKVYPHASDIVWLQNQSGYTVRFVSSGSNTRQSYDSHGRWTCTTRQIDIRRIPYDVANRTYGMYPGYQLTYAQKVSTQTNHGHVLTFTGKNDTRVVLVTDEEIKELPSDPAGQQ